jgi:hypothetical protein
MAPPVLQVQANRSSKVKVQLGLGFWVVVGHLGHTFPLTLTLSLALSLSLSLSLALSDLPSSF